MAETIIKCGNLEIRPDTELASHYCKFITAVEQMADWQYFIHVGDSFTIVLTVIIHDLDKPHDMMNVWKKSGYIKETTQTSICIDTYYTDSDGNCYRRYNITSNGDCTINFDWVLPYTPGNAAQLIAECIRMYEMDIR